MDMNQKFESFITYLFEYWKGRSHSTMEGGLCVWGVRYSNIKQATEGFPGGVCNNSNKK